MSEVQKPIEHASMPLAAETASVAPDSTEPIAPVTNNAEEARVTAAPTTTIETPAVAMAESVKESAVAATPTEDVKPVEEGVMGYKSPGLIKSFIFSKKFFWFGSEPVDSNNLAGYLRGEKPEHANHNAAWSSHTGKGLLFFSKKHTEKANPAGIINLSTVTSDVIPEGHLEFHFTLEGHKHTFQTNTASERDNWVSVLKAKIVEAKDMVDSVTGSEDYKKTHGMLSKPIVGGATPVVPKKFEEKKVEMADTELEKKTDQKEGNTIAQGIMQPTKADNIEEKAEKIVEKAENKGEKKPQEKIRKSRSQSRKRASIFGAVPGFGKKEEKSEEKEEGALPETSVTSEPTTVAPVSEELIATVIPVAAVEEPTTDRPAPTKRSSIFGTLKSQFSSQYKEKKPEPESAAPVVPAKDNVYAKPVSETAPVIPAVETTEPLATSVASPATIPTEVTGEAAAVSGDNKATETLAVKADKRKSSLPWLSRKEKAASSDEETSEGRSLSPFAKLRATVKGKSSPKGAEKKEEKIKEQREENQAVPIEASTDKDEKAPLETIASGSSPIVSEPLPAVPATTTQVSATA